MKPYADTFTTEEIAEHYAALIGDPTGLTREQMLAKLRGTQFDEHAEDN